MLSVRDNETTAAEAAKVDPRRLADAVFSEGLRDVSPGMALTRLVTRLGKIQRSLSDGGDEICL